MSHYKDPYKPARIQWKVRNFVFFVAQVGSHNHLFFFKGKILSSTVLRFRQDPNYDLKVKIDGTDTKR